MVLTDDICNAICIALDSEFNTESETAYEIHKEEIKQGLKEPCFFVQCINAAHEQGLENRYHEENQFMIQYFPESRDSYQAECAAISARLLWALEYATCIGDEKPIRGTGMHSEVVNGVLNFSVNYNLPIRKIIEAPIMETLRSDVHEKE